MNMLKHILAFCACIPTLSSRMNFDWLMRKAIKYLLASLLLFVLAGAVHAEEDKWIDGIKIRYGTLSNTTTFKLPWVENEGSIIEVNKNFKTPDGNLVVICPNTTDNVTCKDCGLYQIATRKTIVGFPAHGVRKKTVSLQVAN